MKQEKIYTLAEIKDTLIKGNPFTGKPLSIRGTYYTTSYGKFILCKDDGSSIRVNLADEDRQSDSLIPGDTATFWGWLNYSRDQDKKDARLSNGSVTFEEGRMELWFNLKKLYDIEHPHHTTIVFSEPEGETSVPENKTPDNKGTLPDKSGKVNYNYIWMALVIVILVILLLLK